jgi:hypothetical protein
MQHNPPQTQNGSDVRKGVNRVTLTARRSLPVFPDERTFSGSVGMSERCRYCCKNRTGPKIPRKASDTSAAFRCPDFSVAPDDHQR